MATRPPRSRPGNPQQPPKRREDNFWYVVMVLAIVSFTVSFWVFYAMTSRINTKTPAVAAQPSVEMATPDPKNSVTPTLLIGEGIGGESPSPSPEASLAANTVQASAAPSLQPSASPSTSPSTGIIAFSSAKPSARPSASPKASPSVTPLHEIKQSPAAMASKAPTADHNATKNDGDQVFRVQVGSYSDRDEAAKAAEELAGMGYSVVMIGDGDKTRIQLGAFGDQDKALHLAEEVTQKGYSVVVRRTPR
jgi:cell division septation protein DedD